MPNKKKVKKAKESSDKAIMVSVTEEMAQPRMTRSARIATEKSDAMDGKSAYCENSSYTAIIWYGPRNDSGKAH
jgi:hypothetical protein